jgi:superfamily I DNA/RNA helicase
VNEGEFFLIGNLMINNGEFDALLIGPNSLIVIEMKDYAGGVTFEFSENGSWKSDDGREIRGGKKENPFRQVRANKYAMADWMRHRFPAYKTERDPLGHISAAVVFSQPVTVRGGIPRGIDLWFAIGDLSWAPSALASRRSDLLAIPGVTAREMLRKMGLGDHHLYDPSNSSGAPSEEAAIKESPDVAPRPSLAILKESGFVKELVALRGIGGQTGIVATRLIQEMQRVPLDPNPFDAMDSDPVPGIEAFHLYRAATGIFIGCFVIGSNHYPMVCGSRERVDVWIANNQGSALVMDAKGRLVLSVVNAPATVATPVIDLNAAPYFSRLDGFSLEEHVPLKGVVKLLSGLGPESVPSDIEEALEPVADDATRQFLRELIVLLADNNLPGARARIAMLDGESCPAVDLPAQLDRVMESGENTDVVASMEDFSERDRERFFSGKGLLDWIVYPHPEQRRIAYADYDRPVILTGVSGSGKTCVLIHRARYLANKYRRPGERIGIITLNRQLADFLKILVDEICSPEERENIVTLSLHDYFASLLKEVGFEKYFNELKKLRGEDSTLRRVIDRADRQVLTDELIQEQDAWFHLMENKHSDFLEWIADLRNHVGEYNVDADQYLHEEVMLIRSALTIAEREQVYERKEDKGAERFRTGRAIPLNQELRRDMLRVTCDFSEYLIAGAELDTLELTQALTPCWKDIQALSPDKRFRCLLVDEFQDLSTLDLRLLHHVVTDKENGLFLAGDKVQKILVKKTELSKCTLGQGDVISKCIRKNYRNSRQILRAASVLANHYGSMAKGMGEDIEVLDPELAERETSKPFAICCDNQIKEAWNLASEVLSVASESWNVCIVTANPTQIAPEEILEQTPQGINAALISGDKVNSPGSVVVSTLETVKGFEFKTVIILGLDEGLFPSFGRHKEEVWRDALRLYVAMTRARDHVYLIHSAQPSEFLRLMREEIHWKGGGWVLLKWVQMIQLERIQVRE